MDRLTVALDAVKHANESVAGHAGRKHRTCDECLDIGVLLLEAQEAIEEAMVERVTPANAWVEADRASLVAPDGRR